MMFFKMKTFCLLYLFLLTHAMHPMQNFIIEQWNNYKSQQFIQQFSSISLVQARKEFIDKDSIVQSKIKEYVKNRFRDSELFSVVFNVAIVLPPETAKNMVEYLLHDNQAAVEKYMNMPVARALEWYAFCEKASRGKIVLLQAYCHHEIGALESSLDTTKTHLFQLTKREMLFFFSLDRRKNSKYSRMELCLLNALAKKIGLKFSPDYDYRPAYSLRNICTVINESVRDGITYVFPIFATPLFFIGLSRLITTRLCQKTVVVEKCVQENNMRRLLNKVITESGYKELLAYRKRALQEKYYSNGDIIKIHIPYILEILAPIGWELYYAGWDRSLEEWRENSLVIPALNVIGMSLGMISYASYGLVCKHFPQLSGGSVVLSILLHLCFGQAKKRLSWNCSWVDESGLDVLLKRTDIVIR